MAELNVFQQLDKEAEEDRKEKEREERQKRREAQAERTKEVFTSFGSTVKKGVKKAKPFLLASRKIGKSKRGRKAKGPLFEEARNPFIGNVGNPFIGGENGKRKRRF